MFEVNSFQIPNILVDEYLDKLNGNDLKILLTIIRKTRGWNKEYDGISISQFQKITGISSHNTIRKSISKLIELNLIEKVEQKGNYPLFKIKDPYQKLTMSKNDNVKNCTTPLPKNDIDPLPKIDNTNNTLIQKYTITKDNNIKKEKDKKEKNFYEKAKESAEIQILLNNLQEDFEYAKKIIDYRYEIQSPFKSVKGLAGVLKDILNTKLKTGKNPEELFEIMSFSEWKTIKASYLKESKSNGGFNKGFDEQRAISESQAFLEEMMGGEA